MEAVAVGDVGGDDAGDPERDDCRFSCSGPNMQTIDCSGRTQRSELRLRRGLPQRIGFGQGKSRMIPGITSAMISSAPRPVLEMIAT